MHKNAKKYIEAINFYDQILLKMNVILIYTLKYYIGVEEVTRDLEII